MSQMRARRGRAKQRTSVLSETFDVGQDALAEVLNGDRARPVLRAGAQEVVERPGASDSYAGVDESHWTAGPPWQPSPQVAGFVLGRTGGASRRDLPAAVGRRPPMTIA